MSRVDTWTKDEDLLLSETVLRHIRQGSTQLKAFDEVGEKLNRTSAGCAFRWNGIVRHNYTEAILFAKKQRLELKRNQKNEKGKPVVIEHEVTENTPLPMKIEGIQKLFEYAGQILQTIVKDNEIWFVAKDVCDVLELSDVSKAVTRLDIDEKGTTIIPTLGGNQSLLIVNESGLYSLILTSRKPEAKQFKRWITHEVIPSIRKTGQYVKPLSEHEQLVATMKLSIEISEEVATVKEEVQDIKYKLSEQLTLNHGQQATLHHAIKQRVESIKDDYDIPKNKLYHQIHSHLRRAFATPKYIFVKRKDFNEAMAWVKSWRPLL